MIIQVLDDAEQDLIDGFNFYDSQELGLGDYFIDSLFSDIDSLHLYAGIHPIRFNYHRMLSQRFPFAIYYEIEGNTVKIWAVLDCRRDPVSTEKRLRNLELK
ncbi:MAG: type II toxin-antitoxin system RelE/ParE family toxin [Candidatus Sabulitectum sp.]|nr:type II toxin-antitoxin system RelE/ParE family toxin [Candidatus Sabulitectum sp.]